MKILVVEDDPSVRTALDRALKVAGFDVALAADGRTGATLAREAVDAIVLDLMLPDIDGIEVCTQVRAAGNRVPILMLTARDAVRDRVAGLDAGADDYVVKPFALDELLARLRALLRRTRPDHPGQVLRFADLTLDMETYEVARAGHALDLTRTEFELLALFMRNPRRVLTRSIIFEQVWGYDFGPTSNSLEVYVGYLRRKTETNGEPRLIHTVRGVGYVLRDA